MNVDTMLRDTLHAYADQAPPNAGLADAARIRARHHRRVRYATATGAAGAVAAVAIGAIGAPLVLAGGGWTGWTEPAGPAPVELVPPGYELPVFPFTPGRTPDGLAEPYVLWDAEVVIEEGGVRLTEGLALIHEPGLEVRIWPADPYSGEHAEDQEVTVQGRPGRLLTDQWRTIVVWQHQPDQWLTVTGWTPDLPPGVSPTDILGYADGLIETPFVAAPAVTFSLVPVGAELGYLDRAHLQLRLAGGGRLSATLFAEPPQVAGYLCATTRPRDSIPIAELTVLPPRDSIPIAELTMIPASDPTVLPTLDPEPSPDPTRLPEPTPIPSGLPPAPVDPTLAALEPTWTRVEVAGWAGAVLAEHTDGASLCLIEDADSERTLLLDGNLAGPDLVQVAEATRITAS